MKKFALLATSMLTLVGMVACGPTESKKEWTTEELSLMTGDNGYLQEALPFYKAQFSVVEDEDLGALVLKGGRKASAKDIEKYVDLLKAKNYKKATGELFDKAGTPFANYVGLQMFYKNFRGDSGFDDKSALRTAVAVGLDAESKLVVYSTTYLDFAFEDSFYYTPAMDYIVEATFGDLGGVAEDYLITPEYQYGSSTDADDDHYTAVKIGTDGSVWNEYNLNGAFTPYFDFTILTEGTDLEGEYDAFIAAIEASGMEEVELTGEAAEHHAYRLAISQSNIFVIYVTNIISDCWRATDGTTLPGYQIAYFMA